VPDDSKTGDLGPTVPGADVIAGRPGGDARVNWSSPLSRGLVCAICDHTGNLVDQSGVSYRDVKNDPKNGLIFDRSGGKQPVIIYSWPHRPTEISAQLVLPPVTAEQSARGMLLLVIGATSQWLELWTKDGNLIAKKYHKHKLQTELSESAAIHLRGYNVLGVTYTISGRLRIYADGYQIGQKFGPFSPLDEGNLYETLVGVGGALYTNYAPDRIMMYLQHDRELTRDEMRGLGADPYSVIMPG